jgi:hypothetical protein
VTAASGPFDILLFNQNPPLKSDADITLVPSPAILTNRINSRYFDFAPADIVLVPPAAFFSVILFGPPPTA